MLTTPLQIILFSSPSCDRAEPFIDAMITAFQGGGTGYLAGADDTGVPIWQFTEAPRETVGRMLRGALHTVAVILLRRSVLADNPKLVAWLNDFGQKTTGKPHAILIIDLDGSRHSLATEVPTLSPIQALSQEQLGEYSVQSTVAALIALRQSIEVVSSGSTKLKPKLKLFVSHAKLDGVSLAKSLSVLIESLPGFASFYDAKDITPGLDFREVLQEGVENSVLIILRSGKFESRPWCLQEMRWAEEHTSPYMVVDLRHALIVPPAKAVFERAPTVWVPDGNQYRIIFMALRESLRSRLHVRIAEELVAKDVLGKRYEILIRQPSMSSLQFLLGRLGPGAPISIVYPDPPLTAADNDAAQAFVESLSAGSELTTPQTLAATALSGGAP
ncbi:MAG: toll/interleukin-1 receptor domain-containing protein [Phyllobacteriaceae bacterium]|nr:toll/interleukin-1 receptor domain-containing protein [Phyllobacteriaceae bacterium]